ncbi:MAG: ATP-binding protein [Gemmatimonadota bacterium]|nr:ATP-binding protein [Gemmatimonadota bacterium]
MKIPFSRALLVAIGGPLTGALLVAGFTLDRRLASELEADARKDLAMAPPLLVDRQTTQAEALRMHARELAGSPDLAGALQSGNRGSALDHARSIASAWPELPVVIDLAGEVWVGPSVAATVQPSESAGEGPYVVRYGEGALHGLALVPVTYDGRPVGSAGVALPLDKEMAEVLAGLTRSDVILVGADNQVVNSTLPADLASAIASAASEPDADGIAEIQVPNGGRFWRTLAGLGPDAAAWFARPVDREMAALPRLRNAALLAAGIALGITLLVGLAVAGTLSRPVRALAHASRGLAEGDFEAPLPRSRVEEVDTVSRAFADMRTALARRLQQLADANAELADRQARLQALQSELVQRDRLVAAGRLVTELAHEIRNPVANVRNSLEVVRRQVEDPKARRFTDLAIEELLRMHDLAERMLDLNRPSGIADPSCNARRVADDVVALAELGDRDGRWDVSVHGGEGVEVAIPADSLKQVLLNLVTNAQEAMPEGGEIEMAIETTGDAAVIEVVDDGPGIPSDVLPRVFDPFFTTKEEVHGVGLGLFIAEGVVRGVGGSLTARRRVEGSGTTLRVELPRATRATSSQGSESQT